MTTDERFFAWLDGELAGAEAAEMEARVSADPALARLAEQHRAFEARLKRSFDSVAEAPVPEKLIAGIRRPEAQVIDFGAARPARHPGWWTMVPQWAAMAATLVVGVFVGTMISQRADPPVELAGEGFYAAAALDQALETKLASAPSESDIRIGLTFRDQSGAICRSFTQARASALACRRGDRWQLRGIFTAPEGQGGDYRMASGTDPNLAALINSTIAGEPFDAAQERAAKESGWR